ncbi:MAG: hypothetical protein ACI9SC_001810 [Gammaproteobacteria bacterium]|jgi:uncharacterized protein (TIGR02444 family)
MFETFWDYSVRTYRKDNVPEACLSLQDERGVDVNMLLYCCWFGLTRGSQQLESFQEVFDFSENWALSVVRPLRHVRTWMKLEGCPDPRIPGESCLELRNKVKGLELTAEKIQQDVLESLTLSIPESTLTLPNQLEAMVNNIFQYFSSVNIVSDNFVMERLTTIIKAGVTDFSVKEIEVALQEKT